MLKGSSAPVNGRVQGFRGWPQRPLSDSAGVRAGSAFLLSLFTIHHSLFVRRSRFLAAFLLSLFTIHNSLFAQGAWRGVYDDAPIAVHITPIKKVYDVGDTFRLSITATNTSDRDLLMKRDWKEQLVLYHIHPTTGEQMEWPGRLLTATWMDSSDVVRLKPNQSYTVSRYIRFWIPDDASTFQFRLKLGGIKDYGRKFDMWQGIVWSNGITLTVRPKP